MENKINVAKLLKDCPMGMELDCLLCNSPIALVDVAVNESTYPIKAVCKDGFIHVLTKYGAIYNHDDAKCVIFPKGKTTWEGFQRPFKDGDIIFTHTNASKGLLENSWVSIFKEYRNNRCACYACLCLSDLELYHDKWEDELLCELCEIEESSLATEEEKQKLFDAIKANDYKWNPETKTLEKLIKPKFKVGDRIQSVLVNLGNIYNVIKIEESSYVVNKHNENRNYHIDFKVQEDWELVPNKFDINTLVPFESRVLVRDGEGQYCDLLDMCKAHCKLSLCEYLGVQLNCVFKKSDKKFEL